VATRHLHLVSGPTPQNWDPRHLPPLSWATARPQEHGCCRTGYPCNSSQLVPSPASAKLEEPVMARAHRLLLLRRPIHMYMFVLYYSYALIICLCQSNLVYRWILFTYICIHTSYHRLWDCTQSQLPGLAIGSDLGAVPPSRCLLMVVGEVEVTYVCRLSGSLIVFDCRRLSPCSLDFQRMLSIFHLLLNSILGLLSLEHDLVGRCGAGLGIPEPHHHICNRWVHIPYRESE